MNRIKTPVESLRLGMYVSALDRPWLESPFLFQGFVLEREEDLNTLRSLCRTVEVDPELSTVDIDTATKSDEPPSAPSRPPPGPSPARQDPPLDADRLVKTAKEVREQRERTHAYLRTLFRDLRMGGTVDTDEAKDFVGGIVDSITDYPDVALWLTQMKNRDEYTSLHCLNVCVLTLAFCHHLGYTRTDLETIGMGALLHDIGKAQTPEAILNKPGPLTPDEWKVMKRHPEDGYQIMSRSAQLPDVPLAIIRGHHRRVNGAGYPDTFPHSELDTPIIATSIADVYDAMTSDRPYHRGLAADAVLRMMQKSASQTFGTDLMDAFIRCVGIFPVGSAVELANGCIALVISAGRTARLLPQVMLLRDRRGNPLQERRLVDLASTARSRPEGGWQIRRVVEPSTYNITQRELILADTGPAPTA